MVIEHGIEIVLNKLILSDILVKLFTILLFRLAFPIKLLQHQIHKILLKCRLIISRFYGSHFVFFNRFLKTHVLISTSTERTLSWKEFKCYE